MGKHELDFRPAKTISHPKKDARSAYPYKEEGPAVKKKFRDEEGAVLIAPRGFLTNPMKKGLIHGKKGQRGPFFDEPGTGALKYVESDYNVAKKERTKEIAEHHALIQEMPFSCAARNNKKGKRYYFGTFNNPMDTIGPIADKELPPKKAEAPYVNIHAEDPPFKASGVNTTAKRVHDTFSKFPGYHKGAIFKTGRRPPPPDDAPPAFRLPSKMKGSCITSIATNTRNLKASYPAFFKK